MTGEYTGSRRITNINKNSEYMAHRNPLFEVREDGLTGKVVHTALAGTSPVEVWSAARSAPHTSDSPRNAHTLAPEDVKEEDTTLTLYNREETPEVKAVKHADYTTVPGVSGAGPHARAGAPLYKESVYSFPTREFASLSYTRLERLLSAVQKRTIALAADRTNRYITFRYGTERQTAGHESPVPRFEITASPFVPFSDKTVLENARAYWQAHRASLFEHLETFELTERLRVVFETEDVLVFCPYVSEYPYEMMLMPKTARPSFERMPVNQRADWARTVAKALRAVKSALHTSDFSLLTRTAPSDGKGYLYFRWYMRIIPEISTPGGSRGPAQFQTCPVAPEDAARRLREAL